MGETDSVLALTTRLARASYSHIMALAQWRNQHTGTQRATWWQTLAAPRRVDLLIALGLLIWALPDVPWWWRPPGHAGPAPAELGALALTVAMSIPFYWRRRFPLPVLALAGAVLAIRAGLQHNITAGPAAGPPGDAAASPWVTPGPGTTPWATPRTWGWPCWSASVSASPSAWAWAMVWAWARATPWAWSAPGWAWRSGTSASLATMSPSAPAWLRRTSAP